VKVTRWNYGSYPLCAGLDGIADVSRTSQASAILTSEGDRESAVNSARGKAEAQILDAEARQRLPFSKRRLKKTIILQAQAERQQQVLKAQGTAEALQIIAKTLKTDPGAREAPVLTAQHYLEMGTKIGSSDSSKVMFMDPAVSQPRWRGCVSDVAQADSNPLQPNCHRSIPTTAFNRLNASSLRAGIVYTDQNSRVW